MLTWAQSYKINVVEQAGVCSQVGAGECTNTTANPQWVRDSIASLIIQETVDFDNSVYIFTFLQRE